MKLSLPFICIALALAGCAAGPDYHRPDAPTGSVFREAAGWQTAQPADDALRGDWWAGYGDPDLDALMERIDIGNQNLAAADAALRQARALATQARSALFPSIGINASERRARSSTSSSSSTNSNFPGVRTTYAASLDASWEVDLWGRLRRGYEGVQANVQASAADLENVRLVARAQLASDFLQLRVVDAQKRLYDDTVAAYERSLTIVRNQYAAGTVARADVVQAETQLQSARAQAIDLDVTRRQLEHAVAVVVGVPPSELRIAPLPIGGVTDAGMAVTGPQLPAIPAALPASLLERRPDIAGAERRMATANAQIGVNEAAWFPALTLSASTGWSAGLIGDLFTAPARTWSLGPALAGTLIDAGQRRAVIEQSRAAYDEQVAVYRQTVLGGLQEVEDNLGALRVLADEAAVQAQATASARLAAQLVLNQYKAGTVGFLSVLTAQTTALANERASLTIEGRRLTAHVALIKALGGGWEVPRAQVSQRD